MFYLKNLKKYFSENSEIFKFTNPSAIAAGSSYTFHFETLNARSGKYLPLEILQLFNNSSVDIEIDDIKTLPSGSDTIIFNKHYLKVKNLHSSTAIAIDEIIITAQGKKK